MTMSKLEKSREDVAVFTPGSGVIVVKELTKTYASAPVVDRLSFTVRAGTVTAFLGPNGAGKTTTIRAVLGLVHPDSGETTVFGLPFTRLDRPMTRIGVMIDGSGFHPRRSGRNHLLALAAAAGVPRSRVEEVLRAVELTPSAGRAVGGYSLGMRQRLGLAAALLGEPELLILDEPANGLDPAGIHWLRRFLRNFTDSGRTVLLSSHLLSEVAVLADEAVVINRGRLVTHTTVAGLTSGTAVVVRSPAPDALRGALAARGATIKSGDGDRLVLTGLTADAVGDAAFEVRVPVHELSETHHTLEDVFLELTQGSNDARTAQV